MNSSVLTIFKNSRLKYFLAAAGLLFIFKLFLNDTNSLLVTAAQEVVIVLTMIFLLLLLFDYFVSKDASPLSFVVNIGILNACVFFVIIFSDTIISSAFDNVNEMIKDPGIVYNIVSVIYVILFLTFLAYVLLTLRHLYLLKQSKNARIYFNTMLLFFVLSALSAKIFSSSEYSFISDTFFIVSILLIVFNSLKISWIAFVIKREKIYLLLLSVIVTALFIINMNNSTSSNVHSLLLAKSFSVSISRFTELTMIYGGIYFTILFFTTLFHIPTAEAFDRKAQEVSSLQYFSKLINQVLDFNDLAETVTDITIKVSNADAAWILWKEDDHYKIIANKNIGFIDADTINNFILQNSGWNNLISTATIELKNSANSINAGKKYSSLLTSPLKSFDNLMGIIAAVKTNDKKFTDEDVNTVTTFSEYASAAIENSHLLKESIEKERLEKELDVAREIQQRILPDKNPEYPNLQISSVFIPAFEVGGDYYDFFKIDENRLGFIIADVSGKGISAAFIMAEVKGIFESLSKTIINPKQILIKANQILINTLDSKTFVSAAYGLIDFNKNKLLLARAGHCPVLLLRDDIAKTVKPAGLGLGLSESDYFEQNLDEIEIELKDNDTIVLYTDGITEAKNEELEDFGENTFTNILMQNINAGADEISNKVIKEVTVFSKNHSQYDDITLVIFKWKQNINNNNPGSKPRLEKMER